MKEASLGVWIQLFLFSVEFCEAVKAGLHCTDEAQNKAETRVCSYPAPCKNHLFMTQLAAGFASKGLLNLMTSSPVATGLAH